MYVCELQGARVFGSAVPIEDLYLEPGWLLTTSGPVADMVVVVFVIEGLQFIPTCGW
jgi:hypothetical protein